MKIIFIKIQTCYYNKFHKKKIYVNNFYNKNIYKNYIYKN